MDRMMAVFRLIGLYWLLGSLAALSGLAHVVDKGLAWIERIALAMVEDDPYY